jgi:hypothetical protein
MGTVNKYNLELNPQIDVRYQGNTLFLNCSVENPKFDGNLDVIWTKDGQPISLFNDKSKLY